MAKKRDQRIVIPPQAELLKRFAKLDTREQAVFSQLFDGKRAREIAKAMGRSLRTIEMCRASIYRKLGVTRFALAVRYGAAIGWPVELPS